MIAVDTEALKTLDAAARSAAAELEAAAQYLNQITEHSDWSCRERAEINERIWEIRRRSAEVTEASGSFAGALARAAGTFTDTENTIAQLFEGVERLLSGVLSVPAPGGTFPAAFGAQLSRMAGGETPAPGETGEGSLPGSSGADAPLCVTDFEALLKGMEKTAI